ncbi:MAG: hypothetical protein PF569_01475 [Candidatus Woesearchaeota archaeon]|jgi:hypothetical protein|nr:hypothetical protein [Candidatus Woesearchaeota archaeon]
MAGLHSGNREDKVEAYAQELSRLKLANPKAPIKFFVTSGEVSEDFCYSEQTIEDVNLTDWALYNDQIFTDYDTLLNEIGYVNDIEDLDSKEVEDIAKDLVTQVILVKLGA